MAQRVFATANDAQHARGADEAPAGGDSRRRAAAYVDLWERQLSFVAAQGAPGAGPDDAAPPHGPAARRGDE